MSRIIYIIFIFSFQNNILNHQMVKRRALHKNVGRRKETIGVANNHVRKGPKVVRRKKKNLKVIRISRAIGEHESLETYLETLFKTYTRVVRIFGTESSVMVKKRF